MANERDMARVVARMAKDKRIRLRTPASEAAISDAERSLGVELPSDYKAFLRMSGSAEIGPNVLQGLGSEAVRLKDDIVTATRSMRMYPKEAGVHQGDVAIWDVGNGDAYCLATDSTKGERCPVIIWYHELGARKRKAKTFVDWLEALLDTPDLIPI